MSTPTLAQLKQAIRIAEQIEQLQSQLASLVGGSASVTARPAVTVAAPVARKGKRKISATHRAKLAVAAKARWAKVKGPGATVATAPVATPTKKKGARNISPEARAKMAAAAKARWAKVKGTTPPAAKAPTAAAPKKKGKLSPEGRAKIVAALKARWAAKKKAK